MRVLTDMIGANFQSLVASHYKPHFLSLLVWEQTDIAKSKSFPLWRFCDETKELWTLSRKKDGELLLISMRSCGLVCTHVLNRTFSSSVYVSVILIKRYEMSFVLRVESLDNNNIPLRSKHTSRGCGRNKLHTLSVKAEEWKKRFQPWK